MYSGMALDGCVVDGLEEEDAVALTDPPAPIWLAMGG